MLCPQPLQVLFLLLHRTTIPLVHAQVLGFSHHFHAQQNDSAPTVGQSCEHLHLNAHGAAASASQSSRTLRAAPHHGRRGSPPPFRVLQWTCMQALWAVASLPSSWSWRPHGRLPPPTLGYMPAHAGMTGRCCGAPAQARTGKGPNQHRPELAQARTGTGPNRHRPEPAQARTRDAPKARRGLSESISARPGRGEAQPELAGVRTRRRRP
jgi:hypothetical protein